MDLKRKCGLSASSNINMQISLLRHLQIASYLCNY